MLLHPLEPRCLLSIIIDHGGTYSGTYTSKDPSIPAVLIRTSEPVIINHATLRSRGDLIATDIDHAHLTVRNTTATALNPNVAGQSPGRFVNADGFDSITLEHNTLISTSGIYLADYAGSRTADDTVTIRYNDARNIDGRCSNGRGGFYPFSARTKAGVTQAGYTDVQFVQLNRVQNVAGIDISWNQVINRPGQSRVEDNISVYDSGGTAASPLLIHDNLIWGAYNVQPWKKNSRSGDWTYDWSYSGGGIMLGDGASGGTHVRAYNNTVVSTTNYGIAVAAGRDISFSNNRILSDGLLPDGRAIAAQNVGAYIWNQSGTGSFGPASGQDNLIGWLDGKARNDWWTPDATQWSATAWPGQLTAKTQKAEWSRWRQTLSAAGLVLGAP